MNPSLGETPFVTGAIAGAMVLVALEDSLESRAVAQALAEEKIETVALPPAECFAARPAVVGVVVLDASALDGEPERLLAALESAHGPEVRVLAVRAKDSPPRHAALRTKVLTVRRPIELEGLSALVRASLDAHGRSLEVGQLSGELKGIARTRSEILSILSHELRAPLTPIIGWTQVLRRGPLDPAKLRNALDVIERNARKQALVIGGLLDLTRAQQGTLELELDEIELRALAFEQIVAQAELASRQGVSLESKGLDREAPPLLVRGDPARVSQIVEQLIGNAIKFTPRGGKVNVRGGTRGSSAFVEVSDTGLGIEGARIDDVFRAFRQAEPGSRRCTGLGTGLALARLLAQANGGTLEAMSAGAGLGSTFTLSLPRLSEQPAILELETQKADADGRDRWSVA